MANKNYGASEYFAQLAAQQNKNKPEPKTKPTEKGVRGEVGQLKTILPKIANDLSFIKKSIASLVKTQETERKAAYFEKQRRKSEEYSAKYKKERPAKEKAAIRSEQKPFLEQVKEILSGILKFALVGLAALGIDKLLSVGGVSTGIQEALKKIIVTIADLIQKGAEILTPMMKDPKIVDSITQLVKKVFTFIADGISASADVFKNIITNPENKDSIGKVIVAVISTVFKGLLSAIDIGGRLLSENADSIKQGVVTVFVKIAEAIAGGLKFTESLLKDPAFTQAVANIFYAIKSFIKTIWETPIQTPIGSVTIGGVLVTLGAAMIAFEAAMAAATAYLLGKGIGSVMGGGKGVSGPGGGGGGAKGKFGRLASIATSGYTTAALGGAALGLNYMRSKEDEKQSLQDAQGYVPASAVSPVKYGTTGAATTEQKGSAVSSAKSFAGKAGADFIASMEGFAGKAYLDPPGNNKNQYSIGFGHLITEAEVKQGFINLGNGKKIDVKGSGGKDTVISKEEAKALLNSDLPKYEAIASRRIGADAWAKLNQDQRNALTSLAYNGGSGMINHLVKNGLRDAILSGDTAGASKIIYEKGIKTSGGKFLAGLDTRRLKEATLFAGATSDVPMQMAAVPTPVPEGSAGPTLANQIQDVAASAKEKAGGAMDSLISTLSSGYESLDKATGGKLGMLSGDLQALLRDKSFLTALQTPEFNDLSRNVNSTDNVAQNEKTPSVYDEVLLSKLSKSFSLN
jgi:GH24 family phage-related lysozyme (muramidase)